MKKIGVFPTLPEKSARKLEPLIEELEKLQKTSGKPADPLRVLAFLVAPTFKRRREIIKAEIAKFK